jgi:hypothetical protein
MKKKYQVLFAVGIACCQQLQTMDEQSKEWGWKKYTIVAGVVSGASAMLYYLYDTYSAPLQISQKDSKELTALLDTATVDELTYWANQACRYGDEHNFKLLVSSLIHRVNGKSLFEKAYREGLLYRRIDVPVCKYPFQSNGLLWQSRQELLSLKDVLEWYYLQARLLTDLLAPDFEDRLNENARMFTHKRLRNHFIMMVGTRDAQDCMAKIVKRYNKSDDETQKTILECAQMFGHTEEILHYMYPCRRAMQKKAYLLVKNQRDMKDITFNWR